MKIKVVEIVGQDAYLIKDRQLNDYIDIYIDGNKIDSNLKSQNIVVRKNSKIEYMPTSKTVIEYSNGFKTMTIEEFKNKPTHYSEGSKEEEVLRAIANRKELKDFYPVYKEETLELVEVEVYGNIQKTGSDFISCVVTGTWDSQPTVYMLNTNAATVDEYKKIVNKYSSQAVFDKLDKTYLRFAKINGSYAFNDYYPFAECSKDKVYTSLEEAIAEEDKIRSMVRDRSMSYIFRDKLSDSKTFSIISYLKSVKKAKTKEVMDEMLSIIIDDLVNYKKEINLNK